jgi:hypothetical protein
MGRADDRSGARRRPAGYLPRLRQRQGDLPGFIEAGIDAYDPLEAKAGLDAVELRREFGHRIAFCGNSDIQVWESGDRDAIRREVLRKLNAAKGGGFIFQSDHSVTSAVSGATFDYIVKLVREYGRYPLRLGNSTCPTFVRRMTPFSPPAP